MSNGERFNQITGDVSSARRYEPGRPAGGALIGQVDGQKSVHAATINGAIPYVSDKPYVVPYNERAECAGWRSNGKKCHAKVPAGGLSAYCEAHGQDR